MIDTAELRRDRETCEAATPNWVAVRCRGWYMNTDPRFRIESRTADGMIQTHVVNSYGEAREADAAFIAAARTRWPLYIDLCEQQQAELAALLAAKEAGL